MFIYTTALGILSSYYNTNGNLLPDNSNNSSNSGGDSSSNIFNISTRDTEENILTSSPTNPSNSVNIAFGTDTYDLYIWNGSSWSKYLNDA